MRALTWTPEHLALLGTQSDPKIAALIGCSAAAVVAKRKKLGIRPAPRIEWTPERIALLGVLSDCAIAALLGCSRSLVKMHRTRRGIAAAPRTRRPPEAWTEDQRALLGRLTDGEVGARIGRSIESVREERTRLNIIPFKELPAAKVVAIRQSFASGMSSTDVAEAYSISRQTAQNIANGAVYRDVGGPIRPVKSKQEAGQLGGKARARSLARAKR